MLDNKTYKVCKECYRGFNKIIESMSKNFEKKIVSLKKQNLKNNKNYPSLETHVNSSLSNKSLTIILLNLFKNLNNDLNSGNFAKVKKRVNTLFLKLKKEEKLSLKKIAKILDEKLPKKKKKKNTSFFKKKKKTNPEKKIKTQKSIFDKLIEENPLSLSLDEEEKKSQSALQDLIANIRNSAEIPYDQNFNSTENFESNALKSLIKTNYNLNFQNSNYEKIENNSLDEKKINCLNNSNRFLPINKIKNESFLLKRPKTGKVRKMSMVDKRKGKRSKRIDGKSSKSTKKISKFGKEMKYFTNNSQSKKK